MSKEVTIDYTILKEDLKKKGYKLTPQRRAIVDTIVVNEGKHLTAEEIYDEVIAMNNGLVPFISKIRSITPPQRGEVIRLIYQAKEGNPHARTRMIGMYLRLAVRIALQRAKAYDLDIEDTIGDACIGLVNAIDKYDPNVNGAFAS